MTQKTFDQLPAAADVTSDDLIPMVNDPSGTPVTQKATAALLSTYARAAGGAVTATTVIPSSTEISINTAQANVPYRGNDRRQSRLRQSEYGLCGDRDEYANGSVGGERNADRHVV
jgi:hypothetical protein